MSSLVETINGGLAGVGPATEGQLHDLLAQFGELNLGDEARLSALATVIAAAAATHHLRHKGIYLEAVKTWALEIAGQLEPAPLRLAFAPGGGPDRKSTRLNSSHTVISYAVFCLKKKKKLPTMRARFFLCSFKHVE